MRETSGSPVTNLFIISFVLTGLIIAAYFVALLIGDLFFPGRWRERVLLGRKFEPKDWEEEKAYVKEYNTPFFIILIVALLTLTWFSQLITGGFLSYYQDLGFALTLMRSEDPDDRLMGLEEMANPFRERSWADPQLHEQVAILVNDSAPEVQKKAIYVAGRLQVVQAGEALVHVFRESEHPDVRGEAAMALGRLEWDRALAYMVARLRAKDVPEIEVLGILHGFAMMEDARAGDGVAAFLGGCSGEGESRSLSEDEVIAAFYAMRKMGHESGSEVSLEVLGGTLCAPNMLERCAAADSLRYVATKEDMTAVQRTYRDIPPQAECEYAMWRYHEEKALEIVEKGPLRAKLVRTIGNQKDNDAYEWIWAVGADESEHPETRKVAETYAREMLAAYKRKHP